MVKIFPSLIAGNLLNIEQEIKKLEPYCDGFHLDIMDFHFVPNLTFGPATVNAIAKKTNKQLSVHLMVDNPIQWIELLALKQHDILTFHQEATNNYEMLIEAIKRRGLLASIAINPSTPLELIFPFINKLDHILLMSVNPGFAGQQFIPDVINKLRKLVDYKTMHNLKFIIAADGGINEYNIAKLTHQGVKEAVVGSALFNAPDQLVMLKKLYDLVGK